MSGGKVIASIALLTALFCAWLFATVRADPGGRLVVCIEVPPDAVQEVELGIAGLSLAGKLQSVPLEPLRETLASLALAGHQILLVDQELPAGFYHSLQIELRSLRGRIGKAWVEPEAPEAGISIPLDLEIVSGQGELLRLRWLPRSVDPEAAVHSPAIAVVREAVPPLGSLAFVACAGSGSIFVVDLGGKRAVDLLWTGGEPRDLAYSVRDQLLFVADPGTSEILVFDGMSRRLIRRLPLSYGDEPIRLLLSPDAESLFVLNYGSRSISRIATRSSQEVARYAVGEMPRDLAFSSRTGRLYVTSELANRVLALDPLTGAELSAFTVEGGPTELAFDGSDEMLYVASSARQRIVAMDARTGAVAGQLTLCAPAVDLVYNDAMRRLYASQPGCGELAVTQPARGLELGNIRLPGQPGRMAIHGRQRFLLVTLAEENQLAVINPTSKRELAIINVGAKPSAVIAP